MCNSTHPLAALESSAPACSGMDGQGGFAELYDTDAFRLYCFKILPCSKVGDQWANCLRTRSHQTRADVLYSSYFAEGAAQLAAVRVRTLGREG